MCRFDVSLTAVTLALFLSMPSGRANAQEDIGASAAKTKIGAPTKVVDNNGKMVGTYQPINEAFGPYGILDTAVITINGTTHQLLVGASGFVTNCAPAAGGISSGLFFFSGSNCTGSASVQVQHGNETLVPLVLDEVSGSSGCMQDNVLYYAQAPFTEIPYGSAGYGSDPEHVSCIPGGGMTWGGSVATFDLSKLNLKAPFKLK